MKSPNKKNWAWADIVAAQIVTELLEYSPHRMGVPRCFTQICAPVLYNSRGQLRPHIAAHGQDNFIQEVRPVATQCLSVAGSTAVFEIRGGILRYGLGAPGANVFIETAAFRVQLTFKRFPRAAGWRRYNQSRYAIARGLPTPPHLPFRFKIIDFHYENIP